MSNPCQCDNCEGVWDESELPQAKDILMRQSLGGTFSDVECPDCGALCFPLEGADLLQYYAIKALDGISEMFVTDKNWKMSDVAGIQKLAAEVGYTYPPGANEVEEEHE